MKWIKASERLPDTKGIYYVKCRYELTQVEYKLTMGFYPVLERKWGSTENEVIEWLDETPSGDGWVRVQDSLPDYDVLVLWLFEDGNMQVISLDKDGNPWLYRNESEGFEFAPATHWRPLPSPPTA